MAISFNPPSFVFVIDTNKYSGNFERQMCAFMTVEVGECGVGDLEAEEFIEKHPAEIFEGLVQQYPDEHGHYRPVTIWATPGRFNNGVGGHFDKGQTVEANEHFSKSCLVQAESARKTYAHSPEHAEERADYWVESSKTSASQYPAYESVGIFFSSKPALRHIKLMQARAQEYAKKHNLQIKSFRLIQLNLVETELEI